MITTILFYIFILVCLRSILRMERQDLFKPNNKDNGPVGDGLGKHIYFARQPKGTIKQTINTLEKLNDYYLNTVKWRSIMIGSLGATILICTLLLRRFPKMWEFATIMVCVFTAFSGLNSYYYYHYHCFANKYGKRNLHYLKKRLVSLK